MTFPENDLGFTTAVCMTRGQSIARVIVGIVLITHELKAVLNDKKTASSSYGHFWSLKVKKNIFVPCEGIVF